MSTKVSLIITTYNWPGALNLCLQSVLKQAMLPNEIIIADDGSKNETANLIHSFKTKTTIPIRHVWQPDEGFQLARIRNKAIAACTRDYIIQIDGDLILHPFFIKDHVEFARHGYFATGSRVIMKNEITQHLIEGGNFDYVDLLTGNSKNFFNRFRSKTLRSLLAGLYKTSGKNKYYVKGCNMAFWKNDLYKVNGYNESFSGWGREDSEIAVRLINANVRKRFIKMGAVCYHLYHKEANRDADMRNIGLMNESILKRRSWTANGLAQHIAVAIAS